MKKLWTTLKGSIPLLIVMLAMAFSSGSIQASVQSGAAATPKALSGSGTSASPYLISTASDLVSFRNMVNAGNNAICGKLTADINLNGSQSDQWTPIGNSTNKYDGIFDGGGFTVRAYISIPPPPKTTKDSSAI